MDLLTVKSVTTTLFELVPQYTSGLSRNNCRQYTVAFQVKLLSSNPK